jgi:hypothetical protein
MSVGTAVLVVLASLGATPSPSPREPAVRPPQARCTAAANQAGEVSGAVLQVIDGRTLCVAFGPTPDQWLQVRLADARADTPRGALMAAAFARNVACTVRRTDALGAVGVCSADGVSVARMAQEPAARAQAASWR